MVVNSVVEYVADETNKRVEAREYVPVFECGLALAGARAGTCSRRKKLEQLEAEIEYLSRADEVERGFLASMGGVVKFEGVQGVAPSWIFS